ncbi:uncharacterized protein LOC129616072 [Condylostylus longicornis]|uniref:uncharacterized protein LOC129616072 n=1 Tax=Condylostylus longicornis TaxID=2530218 RepID=UPI00244E49CC|nr:uncharacterized protein LOC129616072 [Condylostylus longicornis]
MAEATNPTQVEPSENNISENEEPNEVACNPSVDVTELEGDDLEKMKGDAIGDTLYSERFVLNTLLKLTKLDKDLSENEEFEKDLCNLWDMTIEADVVKLLLQHNVLEVFSSIILTTDDRRLTEILVGMAANMCNVSDTRQQLCNNAEILGPIIDLISCSDTLTLIQLMRLLHASLVFENSGDEIVWFQHFKNAEDFVEHFAFILKNSINKSLLIHALEALNSICAKFAVIEIQPDVRDLRFCDVFVKPNLVSGVIEAFKTLIPKENGTENRKNENNEVLPPSQNTKKIMSLFLDLNVILSQYDEVSRECYNSSISDLIICVSQILAPLCSAINLLPLTYNEQGIIENLNEIFLAVGDPFDENIFIQMTSIWDLIELDQSNKHSNDDEWGGDNDSEEEINAEDMCMTILEFLTRTVKNATDTQTQKAIKLQKSETIQKLLDALSNGQSEDDIKECFEKIKMSFELIKEEQLQVCNGNIDKKIEEKR